MNVFCKEGKNGKLWLSINVQVSQLFNDRFLYLPDDRNIFALAKSLDSSVNFSKTKFGRAQLGRAKLGRARLGEGKLERKI